MLSPMRRAPVLLLALLSCSSAPPADLRAAAASWPEADPVFHQDPRWLGADGALTIDLGGDRVLWLFGDTFVATTDAHVRSQSEMVRNTVAVQSGHDPLHARLAFAWNTDPDASPASFFPERGDRWHWPGHGAVVDGHLVVFLGVLRAMPGQGLGFAEDGWRLALVDDPTLPPSAWRPRYVDPPTQPAGVAAFVVGSAVVRVGDHLVALAVGGGSAHHGYLVRWPASALAQGDLTGAEWLTERGWVTSAALGTDSPAMVLDDAGSECSIHRDEAHGRWVHIVSRGFGASTIALRTAPALEGPWSAPVDVFTPPESQGARPFVYGAKAHPELTAPGGDLVVTYASNSLTFGDLFTPAGSASLYWPRFVRLRISPTP